MQLSDVSHIKYKRLCFNVSDCFLSSDCESKADINYFIQSPVNINNALNEFYTLLIDLHKPQEEIWKACYHRTRSEISSFCKHQKFEHIVLSVISSRELSHYIKLFNQFASHKNIRQAEAFRLKAYNKYGILAISYIKQNDQFVCINFYRVTKQRATNLYSFTFKHLPSSFNSTYFGRAHRALHWLDIVEFKKQGVRNYDFCGWYNGSEDKELLNINKFKEQFTGRKVKEYSGVIYNNKLLKLLKKLR